MDFCLSGFPPVEIRRQRQCIRMIPEFHGSGFMKKAEQRPALKHELL
jgi:hypothetical protein